MRNRPSALATLTALLIITTGIHSFALGSHEPILTNWAYEIQEMAIVLMTPVMGTYCYRAAGIGAKRLVDTVFIGFGALCAVLYGYGNYINTGVWEYAYRVYSIGLVATVLVGSVVLFAARKDVTGIPAGMQKALGVVTGIFLAILVAMDTGAAPVPRVITRWSVDLFIVPSILMFWNVLFAVDDMRMLTQLGAGAPAGDGAHVANGTYDIASIKNRFGLSKREGEVIELLLQGKRYDDIGNALFISKATVKTHVFRIYQKAGVRSRIQLVNRVLSPE